MLRSHTERQPRAGLSPDVAILLDRYLPVPPPDDTYQAAALIAQAL